MLGRLGFSAPLFSIAVFAIAACGDGTVRERPRPPIVLDTDLGRFASGLIDAYCAGVDDGCLDDGGIYIRNEVDLYSRHAVTCRELVIEGYSERTRFPFATDPRILESIALELLHGYLGVEYEYDASRVASSLVYDASKAETCFTALRTQCLRVQEVGTLQACRGVFDGTIALGDTCTTDAECAGDTFCGPSIESDMTCTRSVCTARAAEGAACDIDEDGCTPGSDIGYARCESVAGDLRCVVDRIATGLGLGAACELAARDEYRCAPGLGCHWAAGEDGPKCTAPIPRGQSCATDPNSTTDVRPCVRGSVCAPTATGSTCVAARLETRASAPCGATAAPGATCDPYERLACDYLAYPSVCAPVGDGTAGAGCRKKFARTDCNDGLRCATDSTEGTCEYEIQPLGNLHAPCAPMVHWTATCATGLACATNAVTRASTCEPFPFSTGMLCGRDDQCASGLVCASDTVPFPDDPTPAVYSCRQPFVAGHVCTSDAQCQSQICAGLVGQYGGRCGPSPVGSPCVRSQDCVSGVCGGAYYSLCQEYVGIGASCDAAHPCQTGAHCATGGTATGTCVADVADGLACTASSECLSRFCDPTTSACQPTRAIGDLCFEAPGECGSNRCINSITSPSAFACNVVPFAAGLGCSQNSDCISQSCQWNETLSASFCGDPLPVGAPCTQASDCTTERCSYSPPGSPHVCEPALPLRAPCTSAAQCESGICRLPPNLLPGTYYPGRCGDWADICFAGQETSVW